jgi:parvulin-like peptidyl-prolyl isomerase
VLLKTRRRMFQNNDKGLNPMKIVRILGILAISTLWTGSAVVAQAPDLETMDIVTRSVPDGPVARVGSESIQDIDFLLLYRSELARFAARNSEGSISDGNRVRLAVMCVNLLVEQELLHQYAEEHKITVDKADVKKRSDAQYEGLQKRFSESAGREVTESEVLERLGYSKRSEIDQEIERALKVAKVREQIVKDHVANLTPTELEEIYQKNLDNFVLPAAVHLKQIFVRADEADAAARERAKKKANEALGNIFSGLRFDAAAEEFSDIPKSTDMGMIPTNRIPKFMTDPLASMKVEDISDVLESKDGFHIIKLIAQQDGERLTKAEAEDAIRTQMAQRQGGSVIRDFCNELQEQGTEVRVFLELEQNLSRLNGGALPELD